MQIDEDECENILGFFCSQDCRESAVKEFVRDLPAKRVTTAFFDHDIRVNEVEYRRNCITVTSPDKLTDLPGVVEMIQDALGFDAHRVFKNNSVVFYFL
jgi:hypothetical protein